MIESLKQQRERLLALRDRASHSMKVREINEKHPNEAFVDIPYGYIEIGGSRSRREANAEFIASTHELAQCLEAHAKALEDAERLASRWKTMAEYQYGIRVYPDNVGLAYGALDAHFKMGDWEARFHAAIDAAIAASKP